MNAGRGVGRVAGRGSSRVELRTKKNSPEASPARGRFSSGEILGGDSS